MAEGSDKSTKMQQSNRLQRCDTKRPGKDRTDFGYSKPSCSAHVYSSKPWQVHCRHDTMECHSETVSKRNVLRIDERGTHVAVAVEKPEHVLGDEGLLENMAQKCSEVNRAVPRASEWLHNTWRCELHGQLLGSPPELVSSLRRVNKTRVA